MLRTLYSLERDPTAIVQKGGLAPGPVWSGSEALATTEIRSPDRPACSESLYRLSYRGRLTFPRTFHIPGWRHDVIGLYIILCQVDVFASNDEGQLSNEVTKNFLLIVPKGPIPLMLLTLRFLAGSILFASANGPTNTVRSVHQPPTMHACTVCASWRCD